MTARRKKKRPLARRIFKGFFYFIFFLVLLVGILYGIAIVNKDKILESINQELKTAVNGDVHIGGLNFTIFEKFPAFSISLSDVYLRGERYEKYRADFFKADKIYVDIRLGQLLLGTIRLQSLRIKNGSVFIFRAKDGFTNMSIFKKKEVKTDTVQSGFKPTLELQKVSFENMRCLYFDSVKRKSYGIDFLKSELTRTLTDSSRQISIQGDLNFAGLMLKEEKGSYLKNKRTGANLNIEVIQGKHGITVLPSVLQFDKSTVELNGWFDFAAPGSFELNIHSPNLDYQEGNTIVTQALESKLGKFHLDKPVDLTVHLDGSLAGGEPKIDMKFSTARNHFVSGKIEMRDLSFTGSFMNHVDSTKEYGDPNSRLAFDKLTASIAGIPTEAQVSITNLKDPDLRLVSKGRLALKDLNLHTDANRMKFLSGQLKADVNYSGKLMEYLDPTRTHYDGKLEGAVSVENASLELVPQQKKIDKAEVSIRFTGEKMDLEKINMRVNGNPVEIKGSITGFIPFFVQPEKKGYVNLSIHSSRIDLAKLIKKKIETRNKKPAVKGKKRVSDLIDLLYEKVEFDIDIKVDELVKDAFRASDVTGKVKLAKGQFSGGPLKLNTCGGSVALTVTMNDLDKPVNDVTVSADIKNADIKTLFKSFDNFSIKGLTHENISGKVTTRIRLKGRVDDQFKVSMKTISGTVNFSLKNGALKNFEPLEHMSNFLFKNRDFSDVQFAEIKSHMELKGTSVTIHRMEIQSSVIFLFIEGVYSLADDTDLSIQVPLKNLKKKAKDYKPENVGVDAKVGPSVFVRVRNGKDGKLNFAYDPLKKLRKK